MTETRVESDPAAIFHIQYILNAAKHLHTQPAWSEIRSAVENAVGLFSGIAVCNVLCTEQRCTIAFTSPSTVDLRSLTRVLNRCGRFLTNITLSSRPGAPPLFEMVFSLDPHSRLRSEMTCVYEWPRGPRQGAETMSVMIDNIVDQVDKVDKESVRGIVERLVTQYRGSNPLKVDIESDGTDEYTICAKNVWRTTSLEMERIKAVAPARVIDVSYKPTEYTLHVQIRSGNARERDRHLDD